MISFISLIFTLILIAILLVVVCFYSYFRFRRERKNLYYRGQQYKRNIAKKSSLINGAFDKFSISMLSFLIKKYYFFLNLDSADEKKLLKSSSLNLDSSKNSFTTTRSPSRRNFDLKTK